MSDIGEKAKLFTEQDTNENYDQRKIVTDPGIQWERASKWKFEQKESIQEFIQGNTWDEEDVYAVGFPFKRKNDYLMSDFKVTWPITKEETHKRKRHKSFSNTKWYWTEPPSSNMKNSSKAHKYIDHLESQI